MKYHGILLFIFFFQFSFGQEKESKLVSTYISLDTYRDMGMELSQEDHLNLRIHQGDTLVLVPEDLKLPSIGEGRQFTYEYKDRDFLKKYKEVVFWKNEQAIRIWEDEIKLFLDPSIPPKHQATLLDFASGLSAAVDSLEITRVDKKEDANFIVYYTNSGNTFNHEPRLKGKRSSYYLHWDHRQRFEKGFVKVDTDSITDPEYQIASLKYHFFRSLGMFGSSKGFSCESYISTCPVIRSLTPMDIEILKYHYSYGKPLGVDKAGFEKFTAQMLEIYDRDPDAKIFITPSK